MEISPSKNEMKRNERKGSVVIGLRVATKSKRGFNDERSRLNGSISRYNQS